MGILNKQKDYVEAKWWEPTENEKILCTLCPRYCKIGNGQPGFCFIRQNHNDRLYTLGYARPTGFAIDPIEKKPLNHFLPGTTVLSFGTAGCNLGCKFCQNWSMSKAKIDDSNSVNATPDDVISLAIKNKTPSIAYTYNDPTIFGEYVIDISKLGREENIKSVMVTAGYIDKKARKDVYKYIDAANVDLKGFTDRFYWRNTFSHLDDVLDTLIWLKNETDVWFEITTLLIPGENDSEEEIKLECGWILKNLSNKIPLHFTGFHPDFKMKDKKHTPEDTLIKARNIALSMGIKYCYVGNVHNIDGQTTFCTDCGKEIIRRDWHTVISENLSEGRCPHCKTLIDGVFY